MVLFMIAIYNLHVMYIAGQIAGHLKVYGIIEVLTMNVGVLSDRKKCIKNAATLFTMQVLIDQDFQTRYYAPAT